MCHRAFRFVDFPWTKIKWKYSIQHVNAYTLQIFLKKNDILIKTESSACKVEAN